MRRLAARSALDSALLWLAVTIVVDLAGALPSERRLASCECSVFEVTEHIVESTKGMT
jgi:hypothetical protein